MVTGMKDNYYYDEKQRILNHVERAERHYTKLREKLIAPVNLIHSHDSGNCTFRIISSTLFNNFKLKIKGLLGRPKTVLKW